MSQILYLHLKSETRREKNEVNHAEKNWVLAYRKTPKNFYWNSWNKEKGKETITRETQAVSQYYICWNPQLKSHHPKREKTNKQTRNQTPKKKKSKESTITAVCCKGFCKPIYSRFWHNIMRNKNTIKIQPEGSPKFWP